MGSERQPPERIWLQWHGEFDSTWCADQTHDDDIEYVRVAVLPPAGGEPGEPLEATARRAYCAWPGTGDKEFYAAMMALGAALRAVGHTEGGSNGKR